MAFPFGYLPMRHFVEETLRYILCVPTGDPFRQLRERNKPRPGDTSLGKDNFLSAVGARK